MAAATSSVPDTATSVPSAGVEGHAAGQRAEVVQQLELERTLGQQEADDQRQRRHDDARDEAVDNEHRAVFRRLHLRHQPTPPSTPAPIRNSIRPSFAENLQWRTDAEVDAAHVAEVAEDERDDQRAARVAEREARAVEARTGQRDL